MKSLLAVLCVAVVAFGACQSRSTATVPTTHAQPPTSIRADLLPPQLGGLTVNAEDIAKLEKKAGPDSYLGSTRLWALRDGPKLRATLEVGRFVADSEPGDLKFQQRIVAQIGGSSWRVRRLGAKDVYVTSANKQALYIWFADASLLVLSTAADYPAPRALLRQALEVRP